MPETGPRISAPWRISLAAARGPLPSSLMPLLWISTRMPSFSASRLERLPSSSNTCAAESS